MNKAELKQRIAELKEIDAIWKEIPIEQNMTKTTAYHNFEMAAEMLILPLIKAYEEQEIALSKFLDK